MGLLKIIYVIYALWAYSQRKLYALGAYLQRNYMPYGPTQNYLRHICLMGLLTKKIICLMGLLAKKIICLMGLLTKIYALWAYSQRNYALWAYLQRRYMPYGPTRKEIICLMGLLTNYKYFVVPWAYVCNWVI